LKKLISDNPEQERRAGMIEGQIARWFDWQAKNVQLVRGGDREQAAERVNMLSGKNQMDALRESMASFREAEERLDDERQQQLAGAREELQWVLRVAPERHC